LLRLTLNQKENSFKAPPKEWINHRLENLRETLNKNTISSALALKELLAPIVLEPITNENEDFYGIVKGCEKIASPATIPGEPAITLKARKVTVIKNMTITFNLL